MNEIQERTDDHWTTDFDYDWMTDFGSKIENLPSKYLEIIVGNHIGNPVGRFSRRLLKKIFGTNEIFYEAYKIGYEFNRTYVPTLHEYKVARKLLKGA